MEQKSTKGNHLEHSDTATAARILLIYQTTLHECAVNMASMGTNKIPYGCSKVVYMYMLPVGHSSSTGIFCFFGFGASSQPPSAHSEPFSFFFFFSFFLSFFSFFHQPGVISKILEWIRCSTPSPTCNAKLKISCDKKKFCIV